MKELFRKLATHFAFHLIPIQRNKQIIFISLLLFLSYRKKKRIISLTFFFFPQKGEKLIQEGWGGGGKKVWLQLDSLMKPFHAIKDDLEARIILK